MCLTPFLGFYVVELQSNDGLIDKFKIVDISNLLPLFNEFRLKNCKCFLEVCKEQSNSVSPAFFIGVREVLEF